MKRAVLLGEMREKRRKLRNERNVSEEHKASKNRHEAGTKHSDTLIIIFIPGSNNLFSCRYEAEFAGCFIVPPCILLNPENGGDMILRNVA
jgi:hypothetical protein